MNTKTAIATLKMWNVSQSVLHRRAAAETK